MKNIKKYIPLLVIALVVAAAGCMGTNNQTTTTTHGTQSNPLATVTNQTSSTSEVPITTTQNPAGYMPTTPGTYTWRTEIISPPGANTSTFIHEKYNWITSIVHYTDSTTKYDNTTTTTGYWYWYVDRIIGVNNNTITFVGWIPYNVDQTNFVMSTYTATYENGTLKAGFFTLIGIGPKK